jgi:hypothetical protein
VKQPLKKTTTAIRKRVGSINDLRRTDKRWNWIGLGLLSIILQLMLLGFPKAVETVYSQGIFMGIRWAFDYTVGYLPFPFFYVFVVFMISVIIIQYDRRRKQNHLRKSIRYLTKSFFLSLGAWLGALTMIFYVLWGFNYSRMNIEDYLELDVRELTHMELQEEAHWEMERINAVRVLVPFKDEQNPAAQDSARDLRVVDLEDQMRDNLVATLHELDYAAPGRVRCKAVSFGSLTSFTGIYSPFSGEAFINIENIKITLPFIMAHEMAHGYGFTDEGTANFLAYLACEKSEDPAIRYSARFMHLLFIRQEYNDINPGKFKGVMKKYSKFAVNKLEEVGLTHGTGNYTYVNSLIVAWKEKHPDYFKK